MQRVEQFDLKVHERTTARFPRTQQVHASRRLANNKHVHFRNTKADRRVCVSSSTKLFICRGIEGQKRHTDSIDSAGWRKRESKFGSGSGTTRTPVVCRTNASAVNFRADVRDKSIAKSMTCPGDSSCDPKPLLRSTFNKNDSAAGQPRFVSLSGT